MSNTINELPQISVELAKTERADRTSLNWVLVGGSGWGRVAELNAILYNFSLLEKR